MAGGFDVEIRGGEGFERLARSLHAAAADLRPEVMGAIHDVARHADDRFAESAHRTLPRSGGLADDVASIRWAVKAARDEVRITPAETPYDLVRINEGRLLHPVWGGDTWVEQDVTPGWADKPAEQLEHEITDAAHDAATSVIRKI